MSRPQNSKFIRSGKIAIAVVKNVGDREIVVKGTNYENDRGQQDREECRNTGAACGFADSLRSSPQDRRKRALIRKRNARAPKALAASNCQLRILPVLKDQRDYAGNE